MSRSTMSFAIAGLVLLAGVGESALLELDEMKIESSDAFFTMTLDLAGNSQPPLARRDANGDIAVEVRNCVAGPSLSGDSQADISISPPLCRRSCRS